jgi:hypothetical protein
LPGEGIARRALRGRFEKNVQAFLSLDRGREALPLLKRAWVEYLGEPPGAGDDRVDRWRP